VTRPVVHAPLPFEKHTEKKEVRRKNWAGSTGADPQTENMAALLKGNEGWFKKKKKSRIKKTDPGAAGPPPNRGGTIRALMKREGQDQAKTVREKKTKKKRERPELFTSGVEGAEVGRTISCLLTRQDKG